MNFKKALLASSLAFAMSSVSADVYSCSQMQSLTSQYFQGSSLETTMICISYYESSWNTNAQNPSGASGLWQIMPEHCGELCPQCQTPSDLFNPDINAQCALNVYNAQGFQAWTTYDNGDCSNWSQCGSSSGNSSSTDTSSSSNNNSSSYDSSSFDSSSNDTSSDSYSGSSSYNSSSYSGSQTGAATGTGSASGSASGSGSGSGSGSSNSGQRYKFF